VLPRDRVGLGYRPELAAGIFCHADAIDVVEVIADDYFEARASGLRALKTLASQIPVVLHGVSLGMASAVPADARRLEAMARVVGVVEPMFWSEHLAFVRGGGREIGHLAAPPRASATVAGAAANLERAARIVGARPLLENVATLIDPPGSDRDEARWVSDVLAASGADLLLDLHNLHANATNFGFDASEFLRRIPADRIAAIHLAGGRYVRAANGERRLLDDHLHDVPDAVFDLLVEVGRIAPRPLVVILERDGDYPPMQALITELARARAALARGRRRREAAA
jgi:uncharacterized protein (UPF0276 family)